MPRDVFIFIPAYNVQNSLASVLSKISSSIYGRSQVLVIDDGSKDETRKVAEKCMAMCNGRESFFESRASLAYERFERNCGYGAVVKQGITRGLAGGAKYIACLHGDGQYPASMLDRFVEELEKGTVETSCGLALIQGSRRAVEGDARKGGMPLYKRMGGSFLTALENLAFKNKLTDRHSGFIVYNAEFLKTVNLEKLSGSFDIDLELISIADAEGWRMKEIPIPTRYGDEKSNLNVVTYGIRVLRQIARRLFR